MSIYVALSNSGQDNTNAEVNTNFEDWTNGVVDLYNDDCLVTENDTPDLNVKIAAGGVRIKNSAWTANSGLARLYQLINTSEVTVGLSAGDPTNPRIDLVCAKVDPSAPTSTRGTSDGSFVAIEGTPAASPSEPSIPNDGSSYEILARVDVDANASSIVNADITDRRKQSARYKNDLGGWKLMSEYTFVYDSADDPTYVMQITGVDATDYFWKGQKVWVRQGTSDLYFFITKVALNGSDTEITMYGGTDYNLANSTINFVYISEAKAPKGFPMDPDKWTVTVNDTTSFQQASPVANTWYNHLNIVAPIGLWNASINQFFGADQSASTSAVTVECTLSTANNSESNSNISIAHLFLNSTNDTDGQRISLVGRDIIDLTSKTTLYLNIRTLNSSVANIYITGSTVPTKIELICAYL